MASFTWWQIARLGLVQTALGAVVVLMTSTINRVMVVELALPAVVPGALVALHYAMQVLRPRWGYGSDVGGRRTPWILGGTAALCLGGFGAATATVVTATHPAAGLALAALAFVTVGMGAGAAGTNLLALLAAGVAPRRRGAAATLVWVMMIAGFAITGPLAGRFLDPFSGARLMAVSGTVSLIAFAVAALAVLGIEPARKASRGAAAAEKPGFRAVLAQVLAEPSARHFTVFIVVSMLAYSAQDLILEPYAGLAFGMTPGETTRLSGIQHGGVLTGMLFVAGAATGIGGRFFGSLRLWIVAGCLGSAAALGAIAASGTAAALQVAVAGLGFANGVYAVAAIGTMMALAGRDGEAARGTRLGVWGAGQGVAFGTGGFLGTVAVDLMRLAVPGAAHAYGIVFVAEAFLFVAAAVMARRFEAVPTSGGANPLAEAAAYEVEIG